MCVVCNKPLKKLHYNINLDSHYCPDCFKKYPGTNFPLKNTNILTFSNYISLIKLISFHNVVANREFAEIVFPPFPITQLRPAFIAQINFQTGAFNYTTRLILINLRPTIKSEQLYFKLK
jgi:hypothetical protein